MRKRHLIIAALILISVIITGCNVVTGRAKEVLIGQLILNQDKITSVQITEVEGSYYTSDASVEDPIGIASILDTFNIIPVKRLTIGEESAFWPERILATHLSIEFQDNTDPARSTQGLIMIWPDGYVLAIDIESMTGSKRTVSYLSESRYPEIYNNIYTKTEH